FAGGVEPRGTARAAGRAHEPDGDRGWCRGRAYLSHHGEPRQPERHGLWRAGPAPAGNGAGSRRGARAATPVRMGARSLVRRDRAAARMSSFDRLAIGWGSRLPMVMQTEAAECGLACLAMIVGYHGQPGEITELRRRLSVSLKGATLKHLVRMAE